MFWVAGELFGFAFTPVTDVPVYHPDVRVWEVKDKATGKHVGLWYFDPYARHGKALRRMDERVPEPGEVPRQALTPGENSRLHPLGERLEPLHRNRSQVHGSVSFRSVKARDRVGRDGGSVNRPNCGDACSAATCSAAFLLRPSPRPTRSESTIAATSKVRWCGGPGGGDHLVADARPAPGQQLLQGGLEVDPGLGGVLDPRREGGGHGRAPCARSRRRGSRRRSAPRSPPAAAARRRAGPRPGSPR